jgi:hypothetical protein
MTLIDQALNHYREHGPANAAQRDAEFDQARDEFLEHVRKLADTAFAPADTDSLQWTYSEPCALPEAIEEATASLAPNRREYLRYRFDNSELDGRFELVQPCGACGQSRVNAVSSLDDIGRLLSYALPAPTSPATAESGDAR